MPTGPCYLSAPSKYSFTLHDIATALYTPLSSTWTDEDWKVPTTEVDDDHASTEAEEGGPTDDGDKASTPDVEDWAEMEISVTSHDAGIARQCVCVVKTAIAS